MRSVLSEERWQAMRDMYEVHGVPYRLLSIAADIKLSTVRSRGLHNRWVRDTPAGEEAAAETEADAAAAVEDFLPEEGSLDRPGELARFLLKQVEGLLRVAQKGRVDKARIDATWAMIRLVEKAEELARDTVHDTQKRSDEQLAETLRRIDDRIEELAHGYAEQLFAERSGIPD